MRKAYPLSWPLSWPRTKSPSASRFGDWHNKPSVSESTNALMNELRILGVNNIILSTNLTLRIDGMPRSSQRKPDDRGVALYFNLNSDEIVIACDRFSEVGCNIWAISKTINAMRGIDTWGCSDFLKRAFSGFNALPQKSENESINYYDILGVSENSTKDEIIESFRNKAKVYHPDNPRTGDNDKFLMIRKAYNFLIS